MKKIGILIFAAALLLSIFVSSFFSFGRTGARIFSFSFGSGVRGSGKTAVETRDVTGFTGVDVGGVFQVEITAQKDFSVQIEGDDNLVPLVKTEVRGGILRIETGQRVSPSNALRVRISAPNIDNIEASGVANVDLSGVKNGNLHVDTSGASKINIAGETSDLTAEVSGASFINAEELTAQNAIVGASGASRVSVFALNRLEGDASGASRIIYSGNPKSVDKRSSGAGSVREK